MDDQGQAHKALTPHWITDVVMGVAGTLAVVAVAQAALPDPHRELAPEATSPIVQSQVEQTVAAVTAPAFVYADPVEGYDIVSPFGLRQLPWERAGRLHAGVDIAAPYGYPVQATADGMVVWAGTDGGYGRMIVIRHAGGLTSLYAHLSGIGVHFGQEVRLGEEIGRVGSTGSSTGAHLHFEIHDPYNRPLNPEFFIDRQFADAADLPMREAARIPRRVRVAYVSYIPRRKLALMNARRSGDGRQVVELGGKHLTPVAPGGGKLTPSRPQIIYLPPADEPQLTLRPEAHDPVADLPGWPGSS